MNQADQNSTNTTTVLTRKRRRSSLFQPIQDTKSRTRVDPLLEQLDTRVLSTVVETEMGCLERIADKMKEAASDICIDVAHQGNSQCWTGSVLGRYVSCAWYVSRLCSSREYSMTKKA
jgi:3-oxoacyl-[acyl-carrier-protein] synthase III